MDPPIGLTNICSLSSKFLPKSLIFLSQFFQERLLRIKRNFLCGLGLGPSRQIVEFSILGALTTGIAMTSTQSLPPPLHRLEDQPVNLISSSDTNWLLNGAMDSDDVIVPSPQTNGQTNRNGVETTATETPTVIPPLGPENHVVKNNKGVPW